MHVGVALNDVNMCLDGGPPVVGEFRWLGILNFEEHSLGKSTYASLNSLEQRDLDCSSLYIKYLCKHLLHVTHLSSASFTVFSRRKNNL